MRNLCFLTLLPILILAACISPSAPSTAPTPAATNVTAGRTPATLTVSPGTPAWWQPASGASFQIQFTGAAIDSSYDVDVYILDLFETPPELVAELQAAGRRVVCYFSAGSWEDWRPDAGDFPENVIGADYAGWPGERWLDIRRLDALAPIMRARLDLCAAKGFDGADPDNLDGYSNQTGFPLSEQASIDYAQWLAAEAHARGLAIGLKNAPELALVLEPDFDWALSESCFAQAWCADLAPFTAADKPIFAIEYSDAWGPQLADLCQRAAELNISAILKERDLGPWIEGCPAS